MKRLNNLYPQIYSIENLILADKNARKGKATQPGVIAHDKNREENILQLHDMLKNKTYKTSAYTTFTIFEPKERNIHRLPYFHDRITHHAIMNILEPIFVSMFTADTYSCIKGRGIHGCDRAIKKALLNVEKTTYCLKMDVKKFYPSIDHDILKSLLRRKFKDRDLLWLLDEIIDSAPGLPIGNYLSQYLANFYLTPFDYWIKEKIKDYPYFRYADDKAILHDSKEFLHQLRIEIEEYLRTNLKLQLKSNWQVFHVEKRGLDMVGYVYRHYYSKVRKQIKKNCARKIARGANRATIASYNGWFAHAKTINLQKKLFNGII